MAAAQYWTPDLTGTERPERLYALRVTPDLFPVLGVAPLLGRTLTVANIDETEVVLSHGIWQRRFGGDVNVLGRAIRLDEQTFRVVGVMPPSFRFAPFWATQAELWAPLRLVQPASRGAQGLRVFARLRSGVTIEQAQAQVSAITARLESEYPGSNRNVTVNSLTEIVVGDVRPALLVLMGAVAFVLLIACGNVAHMLLARAAARQREFLVRTSLGAGRARVVRQCVLESLVLALSGGALGLALAFAGTRALVAIGPASIPRLDTISLDLRVAVFTLVVAVLAGILFGLVPALQASATLELSGALREEARGLAGGRRTGRARGILVASEFALAVILLVGAGLMIRSFVGLRSINPGFEPRNVLTAIVSVGGSLRTQPGSREVFFPALLERIRSQPGVESASAINHLPIGGDIWGRSFALEGRARPAPGERESATYRVTLPGYFSTMKLPLLRGRDFTAADRLGAPHAVIVNRRFAELHWPNEDALGRRFTFGNPDENPEWLTVVGVVDNATRERWVETPAAELYLPYLQSRQYLEGTGSHVSYLTLVIRTNANPATLIPALRNAVAALDATAVVAQIQTMETVVAAATAEPRFQLQLLAVFAAVALVLAALGIHAVIGYTVSRRTHEIGIRMALGARRTAVIGRIVGEGMMMVVVGAVMGLAGAFALTRLMSGLLYGIEPTDPLTFVVVPVVLLTAALVASWLPALRATRVDPMIALRTD
jgi:putative ABC transport system permease protein